MCSFCKLCLTAIIEFVIFHYNEVFLSQQMISTNVIAMQHLESVCVILHYSKNIKSYNIIYIAFLYWNRRDPLRPRTFRPRTFRPAEVSSPDLSSLRFFVPGPFVSRFRPIPNTFDIYSLLNYACQDVSSHPKYFLHIFFAELHVVSLNPLDVILINWKSILSTMLALVFC